MALLAPLKAEAFDVGKVLHIRVTQYCLRGRMFNGHYVHPGAMAVDRSVFHLGSRFYIPALKRKFVAEDTGGAIIGNHFDVWQKSCREAIQWGSRVVEVWKL